MHIEFYLIIALHFAIGRNDTQLHVIIAEIYGVTWILQVIDSDSFTLSVGKEQLKTACRGDRDLDGSVCTPGADRQGVSIKDDAVGQIDREKERVDMFINTRRAPESEIRHFNIAQRRILDYRHRTVVVVIARHSAPAHYSRQYDMI